MLQALGPRAMVSLGFVLTAVAVLCLTAMSSQDRPWLLSLGFVLLGFGFQSTLFGAYESMLSEAPAEQSGGAAAIGETSYQLGAGIGVALLGSVMNAAYAPGLNHVDGVPARAAASAAHSSARPTRSPPAWARPPAPHCGRPPGTPSSAGCTSPSSPAPCCCWSARGSRCGCRAGRRTPRSGRRRTANLPRARARAGPAAAAASPPRRIPAADPRLPAPGVPAPPRGGDPCRAAPRAVPSEAQITTTASFSR